MGHFGPKLHASDDGGRSWQELPTPASPRQPPEATGPAWTLALTWSLEPGAWSLELGAWSLESAHGTLWAGTLPGGLFGSADGGEHWAMVSTLRPPL